MTDLGKPVQALTPERVSEIMRSDDDGPDALYPSRLGVFCDEDGLVIEADIIVSDRVSKPQRLAMIRQYARDQGWRSDSRGDFCPSCVASGKADH